MDQMALIIASYFMKDGSPDEHLLPITAGATSEFDE